MPELAEIETVRRRIEKSLKGKKVTEVVLDEEDRFLFAFAKVADVRKALLGAKIKGAGRKGKYFWIELDRKPWPLFHLGMSGNIAILAAKPKKPGLYDRGWGGPKLWSEGKGESRHKGREEKPAKASRAGKEAKTKASASRPEPDKRLWFSRLLLIMSDGTELAVTDPRRFGRMWLCAGDPVDHPRIKQLGPDPLLDFPSAKELAAKLKRRKSAIKPVLLDQGLFAGIGNWLADEILFQAKLSPHRLASELSAADVKRLHDKVLSVVKKAVSVEADYEKFPVNWLFHHRWGKNREAKTGAGQKIIHESIGGRTAAWVPSVQS